MPGACWQEIHKEPSFMSDHCTSLPGNGALATALLCLSLLPALSVAQEPGVSMGESLPPVVVSAPRLARDLQETPAAVSVVEQEDLQQGRQHLQLDESLNRVPGVFFQNRYNFAQNLRLSIRGFGARAPFGIRGIFLNLDGFPETLPDGQSQVDTIDLTSASRVEVIRGPSSALYGNASGGVLDISTRDGRGPAEASVGVTAGSYGFRRLEAQGGGEQGPWSGHVSAWHLNYDGYRDQSETEKMLFNTQGRYAFSPDRDLTVVFTALDQPKGQDAGGLSREQVREDRRQASTFAEALNAGQSVEQQRLGVAYRDAALLPGELQFKTFYSRRDFEQQLPFAVVNPSLIGFSRAFYGVSGDYTHSAQLFTLPLTFTAGIEAREQRDDRERFIVNNEGVRGAQTQDALETGTTVGVYGQTDVLLSDRLTMTLGARLDRLRLKIDDRLSGGAASGRETFTEYSLSAGPSYQLHPNHQLYATVGTSFESPTFTEFYDPTEPDDGFDPGLKAQQALNTEVGLKGFLGERTRYELAIFRVTTDDEIVLTESNPDRFSNAGETRRDGIELGLEHFLNADWSLSASYTWSDFRFREFSDEEGNDFSGNRLPGLPEHSLFAELAWRDQNSGWFVMVDTLIVSHVFAEDANDERVAGYGLLNTRAGRRFSVAGQKVEAFLAVNNLTDKAYFSNVRVNANNDNFFEPAPERNLFGGIRLTF
ncbi:MAG: TonB-dependent receptor [Halomonadaceae bacterium]|nr:MAG: TonB-dependent receptor [Halomonadaceae bacterium]